MLWEYCHSRLTPDILAEFPSVSWGVSPGLSHRTISPYGLFWSVIFSSVFNLLEGDSSVLDFLQDLYLQLVIFNSFGLFVLENDLFLMAHFLLNWSTLFVFDMQSDLFDTASSMTTDVRATHPT